MKTVACLMSRPCLSIRPDRPIEEASELMRRGGFRHLPVVEDGRLVGILSDRDVALASHFEGRERQRSRELHSPVRVHEAMTACPVVLSPVDPLSVAIQLAVDRKISAFPVVESDRLLGILTATDLLRFAMERLESEHLVEGPREN